MLKILKFRLLNIVPCHCNEEFGDEDNKIVRTMLTRFYFSSCLLNFNGTMSADIFKHKIAHAIQLKWTFLALKLAVFRCKIVSNFSKKVTPANNKQNLNKMQLWIFFLNFYNWDYGCHLVLVYHLLTCYIVPFKKVL